MLPKPPPSGIVSLLIYAPLVVATFSASAAVAFSLTTTVSGPFAPGAAKGSAPLAALVSACFTCSNACNRFIYARSYKVPNPCDSGS